MDDPKVIRCSFCVGTILEKDIGGTEWKWGKQGETGYYGISGTAYGVEIKNSCPDPLCLARLWVWSRS